MKHSSLHLATPLLAIASLLLLASCSAVKPDGVVDNVVSGNLFGGSGDAAPVPTNVNHVPPPPPPGGPVRWRLDF